MNNPTQTERDFDRNCPTCWNPRYPSPPVSYGEGAKEHHLLCGTCDSELIEMHDLVWAEAFDEWSWHPAEKCPFCGAKVTSQTDEYADACEPDSYQFTIYEYECGAEVAYGGSKTIIDQSIDTGVLCEAGLRQAHPEFIVAAALGREDAELERRRSAPEVIHLVARILREEPKVYGADAVNIWHSYRKGDDR